MKSRDCKFRKNTKEPDENSIMFDPTTNRISAPAFAYVRGPWPPM